MKISTTPAVPSSVGWGSSQMVDGGVPIRINDPKCVGKTFPDYFERFAALATR